MKRVAFALAAIAFVASSAFAEDMDVRALAAKLAAQEARMSDLEAKMAYKACEENVADAITSIRKNATVTLGGYVSTSYLYGTGSVDSRGFDSVVPDTDITKAKYRLGSLEVSDAELYAQIDVNDHFDAFLSMDLHTVGDDAADAYGIAKSYYVRWKNICNTGFGLKVGRDDAAFGDWENQDGYLDTWAAGPGDGSARWELENFEGDAMFPFANGWKYEGITQIAPYWEGLDGRLKVEASLFQNGWNSDGYQNGNLVGTTAFWYDKQDGTRKYHSRNMGFGSGSLRVQYSPIEDLTFTASVINFRSNGFTFPEDNAMLGSLAGQKLMDLSGGQGMYAHASNNTAFNLAFRYTPCFFDRLTVWGQYVHGINVSNIKHFDSDVVNAGFSLGLTDRLSYFAQGDYGRSRYTPKGLSFTGTHYAFYTGLAYELPYGVTLEAGWRHEYSRWKMNGKVASTGRGDILYANVGFEF